MSRTFSAVAGLLACLALTASATAADLDIKRGIPADAYIAVHARSNSERAYQAEYLADAWQTFREEKICERIFKIVSSRLDAEDLAKATAAWEKISEAIEPIEGQAILDAEEAAFGVVWEGSTGQSIVILRLTPAAAEGFEKGVAQLFELAHGLDEEKVKVATSTVADATVTALELPEESPFQPAIARIDDVILMSTSTTVLRNSAELLQDEDAESKFDDERLQEALAELAEPEDAITFFDAKLLYKDLHGISDMIRENAEEKENGEEKKNLERFARVLDRVFEEIAILDYEVTVEYTEDGQNRTEALGKLASNYSDKLLGKVVGQGEPFEDWQSWVPKDATAYSLSPGMNLHELYAGIMDVVNEEFPEAKEHLEKFEDMQDKFDVHLDEDILQSFSGESVSITLPGSNGAPVGVMALRCANEDRIRELLNRAVEGVNKLPNMEQQPVKLAEVEDLAGFQEVQSSFLQMFGVKPVFGFHDGWMIVSGNADAAKKVVELREGEGDSIDAAESLGDFDLDDEGVVYAVSYSDVGAGIRAAADGINQIAGMAPMVLGMAAAEASPEDMKPVQEVIAILPSIAKVVRKFDYFEDKLSITREGPFDGSYLRESVTHIRQPDEDDADESAAADDEGAENEDAEDEDAEDEDAEDEDAESDESETDEAETAAASEDR